MTQMTLNSRSSAGTQTRHRQNPHFIPEPTEADRTVSRGSHEGEDVSHKGILLWGEIKVNKLTQRNIPIAFAFYCHKSVVLLLSDPSLAALCHVRGGLGIGNSAQTFRIGEEI